MRYVQSLDFSLQFQSGMPDASPRTTQKSRNSFPGNPINRHCRGSRISKEWCFREAVEMPLRVGLHQDSVSEANLEGCT